MRPTAYGPFCRLCPRPYVFWGPWAKSTKGPLKANICVRKTKIHWCTWVSSTVYMKKSNAKKWARRSGRRAAGEAIGETQKRGRQMNSPRPESIDRFYFFQENRPQRVVVALWETPDESWNDRRTRLCNCCVLFSLSLFICINFFSAHSKEKLRSWAPSWPGP
jgi:hypothetical protein